MKFTTRYKTLNPTQKQAVDTIDGPVMVVAGPGTGKTELLSMRAAAILQKTDALPENILCLTFTEAGQQAMRERLVEIMGQSGYRVAVHTFHGFAGDVMAKYRSHFFGGATFRIADELVKHRVISSILDTLRHDNPLKTSMNGEYTAVRDSIQAISEIKRSGLVLEELRSILDANDVAIGATERLLEPIFRERISTKTISALENILPELTSINEPQPVELVRKLSLSTMQSLAEALSDAAALGGKTPPITAWKSAWLSKDFDGRTILKARKQQEKLRALLPIYQQYCEILERAELYDYDDMIVQLIHVLETQHDIRFDLQERYQYIMVDEFQDTNMAQARILRNLTNNPIMEDQPNILVVGDDDQAIYGFQGAEVGNILEFSQLYPRHQLITLTDNYRSTAPILEAAREVITQGTERLEHRVPQLNKTLTPHAQHPKNTPRLVELPTASDERAWLAKQIQTAIKNGTPAHEIAVIARKHTDLEALVPYLTERTIAVRYEHRDNVLDNEIVQSLLVLARVVTALYAQRHQEVETLLPELLSHPAWKIPAKTLWQISLRAYRQRQNWLEIMLTIPETTPIAKWLFELAKASAHTPLEPLLDLLVGHTTLETDPAYTSPLKEYYFSDETRQSTILTYARHLEALRTIRSRLREHNPDQTTLFLPAFLDFVALSEATNTSITSLMQIGDETASVHLLSAHGAKGLEFEHVYIINAADSVWGQSARSKSSLISYPANLRLRQHNNTLEERLRLFFVAMTRAKQNLTISYAASSDTAKPQLKPSFLEESDALDFTRPVATHTAQTTLQTVEHLWRDAATTLPPGDMQKALAPVLEKFQLSATSLGAFLDVTKGGPRAFLTEQLLHFPSAKSSHASFGSAIHTTLQRLHIFTNQHGHLPPEEDALHLFEQALDTQQLSATDYEHFLHKGFDALTVFLGEKASEFRASQQAELDFSHQGAQLGKARLKGNLDLVELDPKQRSARIIDYKTGSSFAAWGRGSAYDQIKSHHYKQQLLFYAILMRQSRDYATYSVDHLGIQFVEPNKAGRIVDLTLTPTDEDIKRTEQLIGAVWQRIMQLDFPDTSHYEQSVSGIKAFEDDLLA